MSLERFENSRIASNLWIEPVYCRMIHLSMLLEVFWWLLQKFTRLRLRGLYWKHFRRLNRDNWLSWHLNSPSLFNVHCSTRVINCSICLLHPLIDWLIPFGQILRLYRMKIGIWLLRHCMTTCSQTVWHYKPITLTWFVTAVLFFSESHSILFLSDPGIPGLRSMCPDLWNFIQEVLQT